MRRRAASRVDRKEWCEQTAWTVLTGQTSCKESSRARSPTIRWQGWSCNRSLLGNLSNASITRRWSRSSETHGQTTLIYFRCYTRELRRSKLTSLALENAPRWAQLWMVKILWLAITSTTSQMDTITIVSTCLRVISQLNKNWTTVASCHQSHGLSSVYLELWSQRVSFWNRLSLTMCPGRFQRQR